MQDYLRDQSHCSEQDVIACFSAERSKSGSAKAASHQVLAPVSRLRLGRQLFPVGSACTEAPPPGQMAVQRGGQRRAVTPGNLPNESVKAAGELATGLVARPALHPGN